MAIELRYAARSDVGMIRPDNEDSGYAGPHLLVVADGMGGHAAGELASATAVAIAAGVDANPPNPNDTLAALGTAIDDIGDRIASVIQAHPDLAGMGTTITGLFWSGERMSIVHVGDSRAYLFRDNELLQITHDHTYVQTLVDAGRISEAEAAVHPRRSLLTRALDGMNPVEADLSVRETRVGDRYLLCTDGLTSVVSNSEIAEIIATGEPTGVVTALVERALANGGPDNVTVLIGDIVDVPATDDGFVAPVMPVVVGAAGEPRVRVQLPHLRFPDDAQVDPDRPDLPPDIDSGPPTAEQPLIDSNIVVATDPIAAQRAARRRIIRRRIGFIALGIALLLIVAGITVGVAITWVQSQWYVATSTSCVTPPGSTTPVCSNTVAVYNGVQGSLVGMPLSSLNRPTDIDVATLPLFDQELVAKGIPAANQADAERIVTELQRRAEACAAPFPPEGCPAVTVP